MKLVYIMIQSEPWEESYIHAFIQQHSVLRIQEKNKYGEVFTPRTLIDQILDSLPEEVWSKPSFTWFDPTAGIGNFMVIVYLRLMKGLEIWEPDPVLRRLHILEKMLYMVEMNEENVVKSREIFGLNANIFHGDFFQSPWSENQFDMIVGNPPFQEDCHSKKRVGGKNKLYIRIVDKCLILLKPHGYLAVITPDNLFSGNSVLYRKLIHEELLLLCLDKSLQHFFPKIQQFVCYFVLRKRGTELNGCIKIDCTKIIGNKQNIFYVRLKDRCINPVRDWTIETEKLIEEYVSDEKNLAVYHRGKSLSLYSLDPVEGDYGLLYKPGKNIFTDKKEWVVGLGVPKIVLFLISVKFEWEADYEGKYGVGPNTLYFPVKNEMEGKKWEQFFQGDIYRTLTLATKTNRQFLKISLLQHLATKM